MPIFAKLTILLASVATALNVVTWDAAKGPIPIVINDNGLEYKIETKAENVGEVLKILGIEIRNEDFVFPEIQSSLKSGDTITISRATEIDLKDGLENKKAYTQTRYVRDFLNEQGLVLEEKDRIIPGPDTEIFPDMEIKIIRTGEKIVTETKPIKFSYIYRKNPEVKYGKEKILQYGTRGEKEVTYKIILENGKEIKRWVLEETILEEPKPQIMETGTKIVIGKTQKGFASWYKFRGGMFAASTAIPRGGFARVTRTDTGKSIIVRINDYGPTIPGRIIDLDAVAFKQLAPLWGGVIPVKVEEIL